MRSAGRWCALMLALAACSTSTPSIGGSPAVSPAPGSPYKAPKGVVPPEPDSTKTRKQLPPDVVPRANGLALADVVDVALRNNPQTALSWTQARTAAYQYASTRGTYFPTVDATANLSRAQSVTQTGFVQRSQFAPLVSLSYLLLDFGGRSGSIGAARENTIAVNLDYNAMLQNVVLQAQTVLAQAQLTLETDSGAVKTTHANLATAMGLRADAAFELEMPSDSISVGSAAESADSLIVSALANRPDLAAARVTILQAQQEVRVARSAEYPTVVGGASLGRNYSNLMLFAGNNYALTLGITIPIFNGFGYQYDVAAAKSRVDEQKASTDLLRTQVSSQVVTSYVSLQTAASRVRSADVLLASAQQSEEVARGRYKAGVGTILDLLTAQTALESARAQQAQTRWTWATALAQLAHDVGVLGVHGETPIPVTHDSTTGPK